MRTSSATCASSVTALYYAGLGLKVLCKLLLYHLQLPDPPWKSRHAFQVVLIVRCIADSQQSACCDCTQSAHPGQGAELCATPGPLTSNKRHSFDALHRDATQYASPGPTTGRSAGRAPLPACSAGATLGPRCRTDEAPLNRSRTISTNSRCLRGVHQSASRHHQQCILYYLPLHILLETLRAAV